MIFAAGSDVVWVYPLVLPVLLLTVQGSLASQCFRMNEQKKKKKAKVRVAQKESHFRHLKVILGNPMPDLTGVCFSLLLHVSV